MIIIDYKDRRPIYEQIVERFQDLILKGVLEVDSQLPSVRNLAMDLSINPNTIQRAYAELERKGYIYSVKGRGSFISNNDHLIQCKKDEIFQSITKLMKEAHDLGITKEEFMNKVNEGFKEGMKDD
ncbi:GntR family transcriptional regulator [Mobilisporobacter senegalensis]|uniref:GntR family transcriptional regulator n=1 Tax=Mobilisporobacter senegalensis TaxID=1329262 RepID=A0A3N1XF70_9FIRM|nr:GntR family transcriptional regulator [Mobilisporobacter senegalensis]ROR25325.1 GntR family transcriptional regulator [Mobilisporobacter senegalensis]